ncbi:DNA-binding transcriptional regulator, MarR family [Micromonospora citrea]|uniref:DNA-binding transcriptional regulator, MarR family n=1 Tax=Micromonospora citrea TaxID=47855 RepID=A0A1C6VX99_9ACTN|nr:MarR family transcriptional regulator [Micromonospora citrea]SCL70955.1 DNA-binding transcriptional regulator, MarR family [Micromonospora citrea]
MERLGLVIKRAEQALIAEKTRVLQEFHLTVPQYAVLLVLLRAAEASAAQLARACLVTPQTMATVLANLEEKGLVERAASPLHQRVRIVRLTAEGADLARRADPAVLAVEQRLADAFGVDERRVFTEHLERAIAALAPRDDTPTRQPGRDRP